MGKIILKRNTQIKELQEKIYDLQNKCGELSRKGRETGNFNSVEYDKLSKEIGWLEYLLWGARQGILH